ncbi:unnamed protein product [Echinostoma caproni]|uniref:J domain-containing protein n=1 Tax=Echinostoma caproni TaxID=27848 RepID=A0A183A2Z6_9TREM|nr:unnamed protein product [Echinostoma caproni]
MLRGIHILFITYMLTVGVSGWDSMDLQMFDLIEEVKTSFYDYLGSATINEIRRAYRKLSVSMHPDKNHDDPDADAKFRQLVGVYEILKDPETRQRYDDVLVNGLPDWKTTVYYYRKLRRMSNLELFVLFSVLCTVVHYAVLWGVRFEKSTLLKRHKARDRKREQIDLQIAEQLNKIPKPKWHDILPFAICKGVYSFIAFLPTLLSFFKGQISEKIEERRQLHRELVGKHRKCLAIRYLPSILVALFLLPRQSISINLDFIGCLGKSKAIYVNVPGYDIEKYSYCSE